MILANKIHSQPALYITKKGCTQLESDKVYQLLAQGGSLRVLRFLPPLKRVAMM